MLLKIRLISFVFLLSCFVTEAQKHPQLRYAGLEGGLNISGIRSSGDYDSHKKNFGINLSLSVNYSFSDIASIGASFGLDQKGALDPVHDIRTNLNYLSMPLYVKWVAGDEPRLFLKTGVYASALLGARKTGERIEHGQTITIRENVTSEFATLDGGLFLGGGMVVRLYEDFDFIITVSCSAGLLKIENYPLNNSRNFNFGIGIGYLYYIGFR